MRSQEGPGKDDALASYLVGEGAGVAGDGLPKEAPEPRMLQVLRLATYLAHYSEDVALGLLDVSEDDRGDMLLDARHHFPDVCENRPGAMQTVVLAGALQAFHTLMSRAKTLSGPAASQAFKSAMQALDAIQSSASASYTQIDLGVPGFQK